MSNVNTETGVRFGVVSMQNLESWVYDILDSEGTDCTYRDARLDKKRELQAEADGKDFDCDEDRSSWIEEQLDQWGQEYEADEPVVELRRNEGTPEELHVRTTRLGGAQLLWVFRSPHLTTRPLCSPCVPGAVDLDGAEGAESTAGCGQGYDVPPDWRRKD